MSLLGPAVLAIAMGSLGRSEDYDSGRPYLSNAGNGKCPECYEMANPCCGCLGRVCPNGHLSKKSKHFTPCPKHEVLECANKSYVEKYMNGFSDQQYIR